MTYSNYLIHRHSEFIVVILNLFQNLKASKRFKLLPQVYLYFGKPGFAFTSFICAVCLEVWPAINKKD